MNSEGRDGHGSLRRHPRLRALSQTAARGDRAAERDSSASSCPCFRGARRPARTKFLGDRLRHLRAPEPLSDRADRASTPPARGAPRRSRHASASAAARAFGVNSGLVLVGTMSSGTRFKLRFHRRPVDVAARNRQPCGAQRLRARHRGDALPDGTRRAGERRRSSSRAEPAPVAIYALGGRRRNPAPCRSILWAVAVVADRAGARWPARCWTTRTRSTSRRAWASLAARPPARRAPARWWRRACPGNGAGWLLLALGAGHRP